jgi:Ser/Thr protein kinase RdoA (MazF antagonist)
LKRTTRLPPAPFPQVEPDPLLLARLCEIEGVGAIEAVDARPHLIRFDHADKTWLMRGLPGNQTVDQVRRRHRFLADGSAEGLVPAPFTGKAVGEVAGGLYEIVGWVPGRPWMHNNRLMLAGHSLHRPLPPGAGSLAALAAHVAALHSASEDMVRSGLPVIDVAEFQREKRREWTELRDRIRDSRVQTVHIGRWLSASERVVFASRDVLASVDFFRESPLVVIHGDLWPTHVVESQKGVRLVDWNRAHVSSPLIDVAQMIGRFAGWGAATFEEVVESYNAVRPLTAEERRLLPVFGALDLALETGYMLAEAYIADIDQTSLYAEAARSGAGQMLTSLESIGWSIRKTNQDSREIRREARDRARALREPGRKPQPKSLSSRRPKQ